MEVVALDDKTSPRHERRPRYPRTRPYGNFCQGVFDITPERDALRAARAVDRDIKHQTVLVVAAAAYADRELALAP